MKRFHKAVFFFLFVFGTCAVTPAFAFLRISVWTIDRFANGADVPITIYEDGVPVSVDFSFELDDGEDVVREGWGNTDDNGEAIIEFSDLPNDAHFGGEIWVGDYDDPEAFQTFSFSTDSNLEEKSSGCNLAGIGLFGPALIGLTVAYKKKNL
jgi:hypothetical protein